MYHTNGVLNLPRKKYSHDLRRLAVVQSICGSFEHAGQAIQRATGGRVGKRQLQQLARSAVVDVDGFYAARVPGPSPDGNVVMLAFDGKVIVMRPGASRKAPGWAAASTMHEFTTRFSRGEKRHSQRMAEVGSVYDVTPAHRAVADIIHILGDRLRSGNRSLHAHGKRLSVNIINDVLVVISATLHEATAATLTTPGPGSSDMPINPINAEAHQ